MEMMMITDTVMALQVETERNRDILAMEYWRSRGRPIESAPQMRSEEELRACANAVLVLRAKKMASREGRYRAAIGQAESVLIRANDQLQDCIAAHSRSFDNERALCASRAVELHKLAKRLAELALDAANIAEETP